MALILLGVRIPFLAFQV